LVLISTNVIKEASDTYHWTLTDVLKNFYTRAPLPVSPAKEILQLIANAAGLVLDTELLSGAIRIREPVNDTDYLVGTAQQLGDPSFEIPDRLKSIKIGLHSFSSSGEISEVYKSEMFLSEPMHLVCYFNSGEIVQNPIVNVTNATLGTYNAYARVLTMYIKPINPSDIVTITITGEVIKESVTMIEVYNDPEVVRGMEIVVDNELITEMETVTHLAQHLINYYKRRNHMEVQYIGYPELEVGDRIDIPTVYGDDRGDVVSAKLTFNGGFNGSLKVISTKED
jgi:hypothetical protein